MARGRGRPAGLWTGLGILGTLLLMALSAPLLATEDPWLARGPHGIWSPALCAALGTGTPRATGRDRPILRAPIPHGPNRVDLDRVLQAPSWKHWLGTDGLGRDLGARIVHGACVSLVVGLVSAAVALLLGVPLGALAGYRGRWADAIVSRGIEALLCFPSVLLVLAVLTSAPGWLAALSDSLRISLVLGAIGWTPVARYLRGEFMRLRATDMVAAARAAGAGHLRVVVRHFLPSALAPVLVTASFMVGAAILLEAALSFLGLGVRPPTASWGGILTEAEAHVDRAWWLALYPGLALFSAVLGCNLIGEGLRDLLDPRSRRR